MQHPFIGDLSDKSTEDLRSTISKLTTNLNFAYRTNNSALINQLLMVLDSYQTEYKKQMDNLFKKQNMQDKINIQSKEK